MRSVGSSRATKRPAVGLLQCRFVIHCFCLPCRRLNRSKQLDIPARRLSLCALSVFLAMVSRNLWILLRFVFVRSAKPEACLRVRTPSRRLCLSARFLSALRRISDLARASNCISRRKMLICFAFLSRFVVGFWCCSQPRPLIKVVMCQAVLSVAYETSCLSLSHSRYPVCCSSLGQENFPRVFHRVFLLFA